MAKPTKSMIITMLTSKKFLSTLVTLVSIIALELFGIEIPTETKIAIVTLVSSYNVGQGIADSKK